MPNLSLLWTKIISCLGHGCVKGAHGTRTCWTRWFGDALAGCWWNSFWRDTNIQRSRHPTNRTDHIANWKKTRPSLTNCDRGDHPGISGMDTCRNSQIIVLSPFGSLLPSVVFSDSFYQPPLVKLYWKRPICRPCRCKSLSKASCKGTWRVITGAVQRTRTQSLLSCGCWEWDSSAWQLPCLSLSMYDIPSIRH